MREVRCVALPIYWQHQLSAMLPPPLFPEVFCTLGLRRHI
jgi:hypothetical protein